MKRSVARDPLILAGPGPGPGAREEYQGQRSVRAAGLASVPSSLVLITGQYFLIGLRAERAGVS